MRQWGAIRRAEQRLGWPWERFWCWEGWASPPQAMAFPCVASEEEGDEWLPQLSSLLWAAAFLWALTPFLWASGLFGSKVSFRRRDFHGGLPTLRRIEVDGLRVGLSRGCSPVSHIYMDSERPRNIHAYEAWRQLQAHDNNEAGSPASLAPLNVEMLGFPGNLEGFTVCIVHCSLKLFQGPPLGAVTPPDGKPEASYGSSRGHETEDGDAFQSELACDGWPYSAPNRGHLGLR